MKNARSAIAASLLIVSVEPQALGKNNWQKSLRISAEMLLERRQVDHVIGVKVMSELG